MHNVLQMLKADIGGLSWSGHIAFLAGSVVLMVISLSVMGSGNDWHFVRGCYSKW